MAVQYLSDRTLARLSRRTGLALTRGVARGGWGHWHRCRDVEGRYWRVKSDGTEYEPSPGLRPAP